MSVTATDPDAGDTVTVRLRLGYVDGVGNQFYRLGTFAMTPVGGNVYQYTITQAAIQSYGWAATAARITYDVTARDNHLLDSVTLHDDPSTNFNRINYASSSCVIG